MTRAWRLKAQILAAGGDSDGALAAWCNCHAFKALHGQELDTLARELLARSDSREQARSVYLAWVAEANWSTEAPDAWEALRRLSIPTTGADRAWNLALLERNDRIGWAHYHLGRIALARSDWTQARTALMRAEALEPGNLDALYLLAYACFRGGRLEDADHWLDRLTSREHERRGYSLALRVHRSAQCPDRVVAYSLRAQEAGIALAFDDALVLLEALLTTGRVQTARDVLQGYTELSDPRIRLVRACLAAQDGDIDAALRDLRHLLSVPDIAAQASRRLVALAADQPGRAGLMRVLDAVAETHRDDAYWRVRGEAALADGDTLAAADAWGHVQAVDAALRRRMQGLLSGILAGLYGRGDFAAVVAYPLERRWLPDDELDWVAPIVAAALTALAQQAPADRRGSVLVDLLGDLEQRSPALLAAEPLTPMVGLGALLRGDPAEASRCLGRTCEAPGCPGQVRRLWVAALLSNGQLAKASEVMAAETAAAAHADARLRLIAAALSGDWHAAADWARRAALGGDEEVLGWAAAAMAGAEVDDARAADAGTRAYLQAVSCWQRGQAEAAGSALERIPPGHAMDRSGRRLLSWFRMQAAARHSREDGWSAIASALDDWPEGADRLMTEPGLHPRLVPWLLSNGHRARVQSLFEAALAGAGLGDAAASHRLALFHLAAGQRCLGRGEWSGCIEHWERSSSHLAVALEQGGYLEGWIGARLETYGGAVDGDLACGLRRDLIGWWERVFDTGRVAAEDTAASIDRSVFGDLGLSLRAELEACARLRSLGGFAPGAGRPTKICAGPGYIARYGLEQAFGVFVERLREEQEAEHGGRGWLDRVMQALERVEQGEAAQAPARVEHLERAYSSMRLAMVLARDGHHRAALERLRHGHPPCFPLASSRTCDGPISRACAHELDAFARCNPAFAGPTGRAAHAGSVRAMEIDLLYALGEEGVSSDPLDLTPWEEALRLAGGHAGEAQLRKRIQETGLGRAKTLAGHERLPVAIELLERIQSLAPDEAVATALAELCVGSGIQAANQDDDWAGALEWLRRAHGLHPDSPRVMTNLVLALKGRAGEQFAAGERRAATALLNEAVGYAQDLLQRDPDNTRMRELANQAQRELAMASFDPDAGDVEGFLETIMAASEDGAKRLSTLHHNKGMKLAAAGNLDGAVAELRRALALEPDSDVTRRVLAETFNLRAVARAHDERFEEALQDVEDGLRLSPDYEPLQRNRNSIREALVLRSLMERMTSAGRNRGD